MGCDDDDDDGGGSCFGDGPGGVGYKRNSIWSLVMTEQIFGSHYSWPAWKVFTFILFSGIGFRISRILNVMSVPIVFLRPKQ